MVEGRLAKGCYKLLGLAVLAEDDEPDDVVDPRPPRTYCGGA
jgi:hypothetical protein